MKYLVVKVKDKELYFNADAYIENGELVMEGPYVCDTPMLMCEDQVDSIMEYVDEPLAIGGFTLYNYDTDEQFTKNDLEIREVEVNLI